jgi:ABC-type polysaccharide/polyol phosphate transport system ATPase subunit
LAVEVDDLSVRYRALIEKSQTMKSALRRLGRSHQEIKQIEALNNVSFTVEHGQFLGVIGHNGAGKSTLLRTIAGILPPSNGRVVVNGHVTTLLSVGIGFNSELTGRENIKLGGLANGLTPKEISAREEEIAEFSGLGEFIDYPVKTYSSGMRGRLGFAVAVNMEPDILLIDEALSAGDASFRDKAAQKINELVEKASAIILVSHGLSAVKEMATHALWLDHGRVIKHGDPEDVIDAYTEFVQSGASAAVMDDH